MLTQRYEIGHKGAGDRATHELKRFRDAQDLTRTTVIAFAITITGNILHLDFRHARRFLSYKRRAIRASFSLYDPGGILIETPSGVM